MVAKILLFSSVVVCSKISSASVVNPISSDVNFIDCVVTAIISGVVVVDVKFVTGIN